MIDRCCDDRRRSRLRGRPDLNGIDFLEVVDDKAMPAGQRQRTLHVHFVNPLIAELGDPPPLTLQNLRITGGERVRGLKVVSVAVAEPRDRLVVVVDRPGDFSRYTLRLVADALAELPPAGFDPRLAELDFSFKIECVGASEYLTEFDCQPAQLAPAALEPAPELDYLARDYAGLRRLMLDRLATLLPGWSERSPADLGVVLVELLAYSADHLAYGQDAVASEAYLGTARRRVSVRRHAALVDYAMHEGCNARAWVQLLVDRDLPAAIPAGTPLLSRLPDLPAAVAPSIAAPRLGDALAVFETLHPAERLRLAHNHIGFHTWGDDQCSLPRGATAATLRGDLVDLREGDVLVLEQLRGPATGLRADADPTRRHPVRLTRVRAGRTDPLDGTKITDIAWAVDDALPFDLVLSAQGRDDIAGASGNIVLADHGRSVVGEPLGAPTAPTLFDLPAATAPGCCTPPTPAAIPSRYRPVLRRGPLTHADPVDLRGSARAALRRDVHAALPAITVSHTDDPAVTWSARRDLLRTGPAGRGFVVEVEDDASAALRFGDGVHGQRPRPGVALQARYRVGNGPAGNLGAEALQHIVTAETAIVGVRNPLPALGGHDPESIEDVRQRAPSALHRQARAVTEADYAAIAGAHPQVQRAAAALRWTGSWYTASICVDRIGGAPLDDRLRAELLAHLEPFRMAGHDLEIVEPTHVAVELELDICVDPGHLRSDVKAALHRTFRRVFHPDNFSFGQPVITSRLYAAAQAVPGVVAVEVTTLQRQGQPDTRALAEGALQVGPREIVRLDNDPNFAERGVLRIFTRGGR